ncbi:MAG: AI-2E family transporter [Clostridiales bacterium]|nr:AI-2E family transporter [Clostridiales bacterium]
MLQNKRRWIPPVIGLMLFGFALYRFDAIVTLLQAFIAIISPFILGLFMALVINLPMRRLDQAFVWMDRTSSMKKARRAISLTLSVLIVSVIIALLMIVIIPEIVAAVNRLISGIPGLLKELEQWLVERNTNIREALGLIETDEKDVRSLFQQAYQFLIGGLSYSSGMVISVAQQLLNIIVGLVFAIYLLFSKEQVKEQVTRLINAAFPESISRVTLKVLDMLKKAYSNFLSGQLLQAFISSIMTVLVLMVFAFPYAVLIGLITFVAAFIPVFGPFISGILGTLLVLTEDPGQTLWFLLAFFVVQQLAGSVIYPRIMSTAIDIPSIWVLVAVTVGGGILGIPGMLLFIPFTAVLFHLTADYVAKKEQTKADKGVPIDSV